MGDSSIDFYGVYQSLSASWVWLFLPYVPLTCHHNEQELTGENNSFWFLKILLIKERVINPLLPTGSVTAVLTYYLGITPQAPPVRTMTLFFFRCRNP